MTSTWKSIILLFLLSAIRAVADGASNAVPFVYEVYWKLANLTAEQEARIMVVAYQCAPTNQRPWFVLVTESGERFDGNVYYTPDVRTERMLKGKMISLHSNFMDQRQSPRHETYHVVLSSGQKEYTPSPQNLPFTVEGQLGDQTVIEIVDVARRAIEANAGFPDGVVDRASAFDATDTGKRVAELLTQYRHAPICSIRPTGEVVEVMTAVSRRTLVGFGTWLRLGKKDGKWIVLDKRQWWS
jgi:hypothetical protein